MQPKIAQTKTKIMPARVQELEIKSSDKVPKSKTWADDFDYVEEYAVMGRFKYVKPQTDKPAHFLFRLTTNEKDFNNDKYYYGDRTLACFLKNGNKLSFATYRFDSSPETNFVTDIKVTEA